MASARRLIVNADDFGASRSINAAVIEAHQRGILTTASLMVNGAAAAEAVRLAEQNPRLGVGLHLTLCFGNSALAPAQIPALVNEQGAFRNSPVRAGTIYFFSRAAREQLGAEIDAQFRKFEETGLHLDHVNGHLHFHLHPTVLDLLQRRRGFRALRLTNDPPGIDWSLGSGRWLYRASHAFIFKLLSLRSRSVLEANGIAHTDYVFGLLENARVTQEYILRLLPRLPVGNSELYSHPCREKFKHEYEALISQRVMDAVRSSGIELIRYQDLWRN